MNTIFVVLCALHFCIDALNTFRGSANDRTVKEAPGALDWADLFASLCESGKRSPFVIVNILIELKRCKTPTNEILYDPKVTHRVRKNETLANLLRGRDEEEDFNVFLKVAFTVLEESGREAAVDFLLQKNDYEKYSDSFKTAVAEFIIHSSKKLGSASPVFRVFCPEQIFVYEYDPDRSLLGNCLLFYSARAMERKLKTASSWELLRDSPEVNAIPPPSSLP